MHPKATVDRARTLSGQGFTDRAVAAAVGVPLQTVRNWRTGQRRAPGRTSHRACCYLCYQTPLDEPAYAYLLGLYLGDGHILHGRRDVFSLSIACADAWPGLIVAAEDALRQVMPVSSVSRRQKIGMTEVKSHSKHWPCLFPQHGPGRKHTRPIILADWQQEIVDRYPGDFVRGLIHSDGYRGMNRVRRVWAGEEHWYEYPRYLFSNESLDIMALCGAALDRLGVEWRFARYNMISVAKKESVARLDAHVGSKY
jgi:hypothetical protein